ncbi:MAG: DUF6263 family protein [Chitinophagaceae bacterium]
MKRIFYLLLLSGLFMAVVTTESCQSAKTSTASKMLKFNFEKGKGYDYEMIMNMDQEIMGQKMKMDMTTYYSMDVVEDDGAIKTVTSTYDRFKMDMNIAGMNMEVDSDKPVSGDGTDPMKMLNKILGAIKGRQFTMKIDAEGKVLEVTGFEDMAKLIVDSMGIEGAEGQQLMAQFNKQFNEQSVKNQFERVLYIFPNKEIKIGDSWEKETTSVGMTGGNYNSVYTVTDIEGDMVTLDEKSTIKADEEGAKMNGKVLSKLIVDSKTGLVVSADMDMTITTQAEGQSFDIKAKTKIKGKAR